MPINAPMIRGERDSLLGFLEHQREAVRHAVYGLSDEQARATPTASSLSLGGLVKHLAWGERGWTARLRRDESSPPEEGSMEEYVASFALAPGETLAGALRDYESAAADTDATVRGIEDLGRAVHLSAAPWAPETGGCTVRWVLLHLVEETARHAGHADILREALDGALSGPLMAAAEGWPEDGWVKPWRPPG